LRKSWIVLSTFLLVFLLATPALAADVNLNINGKPYQPMILPQIEYGTCLCGGKSTGGGNYYSG
jgi:hypothetical protein